MAADGICLVLAEDCDGWRLDLALARIFLEKSRSQIQRAMAQGLILVDGQVPRPGQRARAGQRVQVRWPVAERPRPRPGKLTILFEDEVLVAVDKPAGAVVHPTPHGGESLVELLLEHTGGKLARGQDPIRPGVVHRLDRDTSGVLLFAKEEGALLSLQRQFQRRRVEKCYQAIAAGHPCRCRGTIDGPIGRDPRRRTRMAIREDGRPARSDWEILRRCAGGWCHLAVHIHSGRTHQIRVHLASMGHPILGDRTYGPMPPPPFPFVPPRLLLHAAELRCGHPETGQPLLLRAPLPADFIPFLGATPVGQEPVAPVAEKEGDGDAALADGLDCQE
ncbi:MAG: RluA family pseudouridine synthase [Puniceicoccales bacterium]|jgi:23S rRNA pseudouridine1911/1915/1917 synthase|nr:RluA family pseudouridine synthase [Puniceicoccales bacterium]